MSPFDPFSPNADPSIPINTDTPIDGSVVLVNYDAAWPGMFAAEAAHIWAALGDRALVLEHIGSTSVPGLIAKPCIDMVLGVADSADEDAYVPDLTAHGFVWRRSDGMVVFCDPLATLWFERLCMETRVSDEPLAMELIRATGRGDRTSGEE